MRFSTYSQSLETSQPDRVDLRIFRVKMNKLQKENYALFAIKTAVHRHEYNQIE